MRFKDVFSIIGPAMIGPSSSHTAGAVRLGRVARQLLGMQPGEADISFYGSFAETHRGHGTDLAIVGGLLDLAPDHPGIRTSLEEAEKQGLTVRFHEGKGLAPHPNTVRLHLTGGANTLHMAGASIGGGNIEVYGIDDFDVKFTGAYPTLVLSHTDHPGVLADVTRLLADRSINIGCMDVDRTSRSGEALTVLEVDGPVPKDLTGCLEKLSRIRKVMLIDITEGAAT